MTEAPATIRGLLLARAADDHAGLLAGDERWSWREVVDAARVRAGWLDAVAPRDPGRDRAHVGLLLENIPEYVFLLGAAALGRGVVVGLNPTRTGGALSRDIDHTACDVVLVEPATAGYLDGVDLDVPVIDVTSPDWADALAPHGDQPLPKGAGEPADPFVMILTSGTTAAPKAVVCSIGKIGYQGSVVPHLVQLTGDDVTYLAMPLYHSNAIIAGWAPTVAVGGTAALARRFSASGFLDDVRRYGATYANYVGTPLSYVLAQPPRPDDADNPLRLLFGNEGAPADLARFSERFDCRVIDAYGSTEGGISIVRTPETPPEALGLGVGNIQVLHPSTGAPCPPAEFDDAGRLTNAAEAIGELVNLDGRGAFEGYWANPEAESERLRDGRYHSGDLGYRDADGFLYFAGRLGEWLRVGGENFAAAPVQRILARHPEVIEAVVVGVPDATAGDQVLAVLMAGERFNLDGFATWMRGQSDLSPRWRPRYLRVVDDLPRTGTGKIRRRDLQSAAWLPEDTWVVDGTTYRRLTVEDRDRIRKAFADAGRGHVHP